MGFRYGVDDVRGLVFARASVIRRYQKLPANWKWGIVDRLAYAPYYVYTYRDGTWVEAHDIDVGDPFLFPWDVSELLNHLEGLLFCGHDEGVLEQCRVLMSLYRTAKGQGQ